MTLTIYDAADIPQCGTEWLEARRGIVTASTVGKLLTSTGKIANNDTSRGLIETLVAERITGRVEYVHPTRDMQRGTLLEPEARRIYAEHYGPVEEIGFMRLDGPNAHALGYSPDGLVGEDGLLEIKSRTPRIHISTILSGSVPRANIPQLMAGLLVSGRSWIDYCSYSPGLPLYVKRVYPNTEWFAAISEAVELYTQKATELMGTYHYRTADMPATEWWDPFDTGEEIY